MMEGRKVVSVAAVTLVASLAGGACAVFEDELVAKGRHLYMYYCAHCHGPEGQGDGFNAAYLDPPPRDLSEREEKILSKMSDQEIFEAISREMQTSEEFEKEFGEDTPFVLPTMPTFKDTLSERERWALAAFLRSSYGAKLEVDLAALQREREEKVKQAQAKLDEAQKALAAAQKAAKPDGDDDPDLSKEEETVAQAESRRAEARAALERFLDRPAMQPIPRPVLASSPADLDRLAEVGKYLFAEKYGCVACHAIGNEGGHVGPPLDRAGPRLTATWVYRWIRNPQDIEPETVMPNLGVSDADARAITAYLGTLRAAPGTAPPDAGPQQMAAN